MAGTFPASRQGRSKINDAQLGRSAGIDRRFDAEKELVAQFDTLQKLSEYERRSILGERFFTQIREFFNLFPTPESSLPFRPTLRIPYLQTLAIIDSMDLASLEPRTYLVKPAMPKDQARDKARELAFRAQWRANHTLGQVLYSLLWSWLAGTAFWQVAWDSRAAEGQGDVVIRWRDPEGVYPDPYTYDDEHWRYVMWEDWMWLDEVRELWGTAAERIKPRFGSGEPGTPGTLNQSDIVGGATQRSPFDYPPGPLRSIGGLPHTQQTGDGRVRVRTLFVRDSARARLKRTSGKAEPLALDAIPAPEQIALYPRGRYIVEAEGVILNPSIEDQQNPFLHGQFPIVRLLGFPAITSFWAPPPTRYSKGLQEAAERWWAQIYENGSRLNNGVTFVDQNTGIAEDAYGGVPGELHMIAPNSRVPEIKFPPAMPAHMVEIPKIMLDMQDRTQGFNQQRLGSSVAGNISAPQFEAAVAQSSGLTRTRALLLFQAVRRLEHLRFATMAQFYKQARVFPDPSPDDVGLVEWTPMSEEELVGYQVVLDKASLEPMSQTALRMMVPLLGKIGWLDAQSGLETLGWPNVRETLNRLNAQAKAKADHELQVKGKAKKHE